MSKISYGQQSHKTYKSHMSVGSTFTLNPNKINKSQNQLKFDPAYSKDFLCYNTGDASASGQPQLDKEMSPSQAQMQSIVLGVNDPNNMLQITPNQITELEDNSN